jgi:FAD/FMN-containing dehydrogenase
VQKLEGGSIKHDVSVPVSKIPELIERGIAAVLDFMPDSRPMPFGHIGDGNLHFNVTQPEGMDHKAFLGRWADMSERVYEVVLDLGGSVSAEHGVGRLKRNMMPRIKSKAELHMMRQLKTLFDPRGILNPHKVLPE